MKFLPILLLFAAAPVFAQNAPAQSGDAQAPAQAPAQAAPANTTPRVFLQAQSNGNTWNSRRDQGMEMAKDFEKTCPSVKITINQQNADYTVVLNHIEVGLFNRDNQVQVANKNGDLLKNKEGGSIKGNVKSACNLIMSDWNAQHASESAPQQ